MASLRAFRDVVVILWREGPDMLTRWLDRLTDDLNEFTRKTDKRG